MATPSNFTCRCRIKHLESVILNSSFVGLDVEAIEFLTTGRITDPGHGFKFDFYSKDSKRGSLRLQLAADIMPDIRSGG